MRRSAGMALILVLLVMSVVVIFILTGLEVTGKNLLFLNGTYQRNVCLAAAEAGVYAAISQLEQNVNYAGPLSGHLKNGTSFTVTLTRSGQKVQLLSAGTDGRATRKVQVTVAAAADSFDGLGTQGLVVVGGPAYVNAIQGTLNPLPDKGNIHTNSADGSAIAVDNKLSVTGLASAVGGISGTVDGKKKPNDATANLGQVDKAALLTGAFTTGPLPADGVVSTNLHITGDLESFTPIVLQNGAVIHVDGDCMLHKGVTGNGSVVSEGGILLRGTNALDLTNTKGVTLYSEKQMTLTSPLAAVDTDSQQFEAPVDPVGAYFASMPEDATYILGQRLPADAPIGQDFFNWYKQQSDSPTSTFRLWRDGDGSELSPGLPSKVKTWLDASIPLNGQLNSWAAAGL